MKPTKKFWLAIAAAVPLTVAAPALASAAAGAPSAAHPSYVHAAPGSLRPTPRLVHPAHPFETHPLQRGTTHSAQRGSKFGVTTSNGWSGFATYSDHFRYVSATYTIPSLNCSVSPDGSFDSQWVGLDGYTTNTVEQVGDYAQCVGGTPNYYAFWEMYPNGSNTFTGVSPGDSMTATVYYNGSQWELTLVDNTTLTTIISQTESCPSGITCHNANAEIVSEVPDGGPPAAELGDYGIVGFTHIGITDTAGHRYNILSPKWSNDKISEVDTGTGDLMQQPSKLEGTATGTGGGWGNQAFTDQAIAPE
jgi:Peptidase A4 family